MDIERLLTAHAMARGGEPEAAAALCHDVLSREPGNSFALHLLGSLALRAGRAGEAVDLLRQAADGRPENLDTRLLLAEALERLGDDAGCATVLTAVVALWPRHAPAWAALAMAHLRRHETEQALVAAELARRADPTAVEPMVAAGTAHAAAGRPAEAVRMLRAAVMRDPRHARAHLNLGNAQMLQGSLDDAEWHLRQATVLAPTMAEAWASLGVLQTGQDRMEDALAALNEAVRLRPDQAEFRWNRSFAHLRAGDYIRGWVDYEWRRQHRGLGRPIALPGPEWQGGPLGGRRLLVVAGQGAGDAIQFARFLPLLAERAGAVELRCAPALVPLLRQLPVQVAPHGGRLPAYDHWIDLMSVPSRLGVTAHAIPRAGGYLAADSASRSSLLARSGMHGVNSACRGIGGGHDAGLRIGLVCAGNPQHGNDMRRSMRPADLAPLRAIPGASFVSLQVGPCAGELARLFRIPDLSGRLDDFAATAKLIAGLDVVVAVDTAVAHLAGAMGVPAFVLLPNAPDWRWLAATDRSPWYASMRVFRQQQPGDWAGVVAQVGGALGRLPAASANV